MLNTGEAFHHLPVVVLQINISVVVRLTLISFVCGGSVVLRSVDKVKVAIQQEQLVVKVSKSSAFSIIDEFSDNLNNAAARWI